MVRGIEVFPCILPPYVKAVITAVYTVSGYIYRMELLHVKLVGDQLWVQNAPPP